MHRLVAKDGDHHAPLRERMDRVGIPTWRLTHDGRVLRAPQSRGVLSTWLCNPVLVDRLSTCVASLEEKAPEGLLELCPGCRVCLIPLRMRRRVAEWTAAMFFGDDLTASTEYHEGCRRAGVDPVATARALTPMLSFGDAEIDRLCTLLREMADDLERSQKDHASLDGFTQTLTDAYEHIELTYGLARTMHQMSDAAAFIGEALQGLLDATQFAWDALVVTSCSADNDGRPTYVAAGRVPFNAERLHAWVAQHMAGLQSDQGTLILSDERVRGLLGRQDQVVIFPITRNGQPVGVLIGGDKGGDDPQVSTYDTRVFDTVGAFIQSYVEIFSLLQVQQQMFLGSLRAITAAVDAKDSYTRGHSERVAHLAALLGTAIGLSEQELERVHIAGLMHDVGKIGVPEAVLCKPGKLTDEEFDAIKRHPRIGYDILRGIPQLADILPGVLWHHERFDGRGYPDGLKGEKIPRLARMLALADTFDAMSSNRSYRPAMPRDRVLEEINRVSGAQFDPALAAAFVKLDFAEYDRMVERHRPQRQLAAEPPDSLAA